MANFKDKNNKGGGKGKSTSLGQRKNYRNSYEKKEEGGYFGNPHDKTKRQVKSTQDDSVGKTSNRFGGQKRKRIGESTVIEGGYYGNPFGKDEPKKRSYGEKRNFGEEKSGGYGEKRNYGKRNYGNNNNNESFNKDDNNGEFKKRSYGEKRNFGEEKSGGYGEKRNYGKRNFGNNNNESFNKDDSNGEFKKRSYGEKRNFGEEKSGGYGEKRNYGKRNFGNNNNESFNKDDNNGEFKKRSYSEKRNFGEEKSGGYGEKRNYGKRNFSNNNNNESFNKDDNNGEFKKRSYGEKRNFGEEKSGGYGEKRNYGKRNFGNNNNESFNKDDNNGEFKKRSYGEKRNFGEKKDFGGKKRYNNDDDMDLKSLLSDGEDLGFTEETSKRNFRDKAKSTRNNRQENSNFDNKKPFNRKNNTEDFEVKEVNGLVRLNRFIANAGVCSRREADKLIENGQVTVNGKTMKELGYQVKPTDEVRYMGELLSRERPVYILLNKPKDHITTTDDPEGRKTVMNLVKQVGDDVRIYPVGRLDRNTTGLLIMTNDGKFAAKLSHPSSNIKKTYYVTIDKPITEEELSKFLEGVELEDGVSKFDSLEVLTSDYLNISVTLHSGKNRIVRRMFNHLGYEVERLDRISYAGLSKKGLERGSWRHLTKAEVMRLKYLLR